MRDKFLQFQLDGGVLKILMIDFFIVSYVMMLQLFAHFAVGAQICFYAVLSTRL